ncbi:Esterase/lipase [Brachybacterium nesterenkovii]|uniref:Esterase/lipase n=2 Tax=Brachybacterium nesterenkovii TaxID=47847 RepID=A0A1X6X258_9MICO|nr:Esterase/lipase [Brachybacterium nesterenkovii]
MAMPMPPDALRRRGLTNPVARAALRMVSAPRLDMREDYPRVRRFQRRLARRPLPRYRFLDRTIRSADDGHDIPVRIFSPRERRRDEVLLFLHGGGWVTGDIESYTPACATMADLTGCVVASVDYRLAPEHPFPAGLEDCVRVTCLLLDEPERAGLADARDIVLVGDSAGGNLAACTSLVLAREGHRGVRRQILLYPVTGDDHDPATSPHESVRRHGADYRLTAAEIQDYLEMYVPDPARRRDELVAPLHAADLRGQPATLVVTAELDLLCDEGEAYAAALADAGVPVRTHRVAGALHGFIALPRFSRSLREGYGAIEAFLEEDIAAGDSTAEESSAGDSGAAASTGTGTNGAESRSSAEPQ